MKRRQLCQHHFPVKKSYGDNFHTFLTQTITITTSNDSKAPNTLQIALYKPFAAELKYSVPALWIIQPHLLDCRESKSTSISIHWYVDLRRSLILYGKHQRNP